VAWRGVERRTVVVDFTGQQRGEHLASSSSVLRPIVPDFRFLSFFYNSWSWGAEALRIRVKRASEHGIKVDRRHGAGPGCLYACVRAEASCRFGTEAIQEHRRLPLSCTHRRRPSTRARLSSGAPPSGTRRIALRPTRLVFARVPLWLLIRFLRSFVQSVCNARTGKSIDLLLPSGRFPGLKYYFPLFWFSQAGSELSVLQSRHRRAQACRLRLRGVVRGREGHVGPGGHALLRGARGRRFLRLGSGHAGPALPPRRRGAATAASPPHGWKHRGLPACR
jgi:hypothetical protein